MGDFPKKSDIFFDAELSGELFQTLALGTIPDYGEAYVGNTLCDKSYGFYTDIHALLLREPPDRTDDI